MIEIGRKFTMNNGTKLEVLEYINAHKILVQFDDKKSLPFTACTSNLQKGMYRNPYHPTIEGIGYEGQGDYSFKQDGRCAIMWRSMIARCFSKKWNRVRVPEQPRVIENWFNFQNFAEWYYNQSGSSLGNWELDKDIIVKGNRTYSPETCCLVPREINTAYPMSYSQGSRVYYNSKDRYYRVNWRDESGKRSVKGFKTQEEAVDFKVLKTKERLQNLADKYVDNLDPVVYNLLMNWKGFYGQG